MPDHFPRDNLSVVHPKRKIAKDARIRRGQNPAELFIPLISGLSSSYRGDAARKDRIPSTQSLSLSTTFSCFIHRCWETRARVLVYRRITVAPEVDRDHESRMDKRNDATARQCVSFFPSSHFLPSSPALALFLFLPRRVHGRTSSEQMAEYDSRAKLASEYFAANADFANHLSIEPLGLPWPWPEGTL